jgi:alpha-L-rhamnosidase
MRTKRPSWIEHWKLSAAGLAGILTLLIALNSQAAAPPVPSEASPALTVTDLRCEYVSNPLGVDVAAPRLFWKLESSTRNERQTAYEILASSTAGALAKDIGDLWDTGKVESDETIQIPYQGKPLKSSQQVFWKVRVWDKDGKVSAWSPEATWTMGLLDRADWHAQWIAAERGSETLLLRREFAVKPGLKRALAYVSGLGYYELSVNGRKAGGDLLSPGWTKYDKTCLYDSHDLTPLLKEGRNAVGLLLGNGMYNVEGKRYTKFKGSFGPLKAIMQLRLEYADGTTESIGTGEKWRTSPGPITFSDVYGGEDYDARLQQAGWNQSGFDDSKWQPARLAPGPGGILKGLSAAAPPIRAFDVLKPVSVKHLSSGVTVYDLGQNASLIPRMTVKGAAGSVVKIVPAELLNKDGSVNRRSAEPDLKPSYWQYTLAGNGSEEWFPKFFYHGARYLQVECSAPQGDKLPVVESLEGVVIHSSSPAAGAFENSDELFNRIYKLIRWAQVNNMVSVLTDCPHRERLGWLEQYHLNGPSLRYDFNLGRLFTKGMSDMADSQLADGLVPDIAPEYTVFEGGFRDSPEWGSAFVLVPWQQYEWDGDGELLRQHYDEMERYVAYLGSRADNHILSYGLGDWYDLGPKPPGYAQLTPVALTATAFYYEDASILARAAALLGKTDDAREYQELAAQIRSAFNQKFFNEQTNQYATGSQCANAIPLVMGIVEPKDRDAVLANMVRDVREHGNSLTAGDVGYRYLLRALAEGGRSDVVFEMNNQSDKPGYGYQLKMGATSLTEAWNANPRSSQDHFMLGQIIEWFYHDLAGIGGDPTGPGFKKIIINPQPVGDVTWVKASYDSIRGKIISHWTKESDGFRLSITVPPNTSATVFVPAPAAGQVMVDGKNLTRESGAKFLRQEKDRSVFEVGSGHWVFESRI